jgi:hypothetical protein
MFKLICTGLLAALLLGCNPTIRLETPKEPIRIEIAATIRIVIEKDVEQILANDELF